MAAVEFVHSKRKIEDYYYQFKNGGVFGGSGHLGSSLTDGRMETGVRKGNGFVRINYVNS